MTQEERTLLHIDLSERVPYDTVLKVRGLVTSNEEFGDAYLDTVSWYEEVSVRDGSRVSYDIADVKPYLRPMSSMTEEERKEVENLIKENRPSPYGIINNKGIDNLLFSVSVTSGVLNDWLNAHHFDYRGLIEKGLAIEVTEDNNCD